jgi:hypothetical protein
MSRSFTATDPDYIIASDVSAIDVTGTSWTVAVWFKVNSIGAEHKIVAKWDGNSSLLQYLITVTSGGNLVGATTDPGFNVATGSTTLSASAWYHAALVQRGTGSNTLELYLNGVLEASASPAAGPANTSAFFKIGAGGDNSLHENPHDGRISRVAVWNATALTTGQITSLQTGSPNDVAPTGLTFYTIDTANEVVDYASAITLTDVGTAYSSDEPFVEAATALPPAFRSVQPRHVRRYM